MWNLLEDPQATAADREGDKRGQIQSDDTFNDSFFSKIQQYFIMPLFHWSRDLVFHIR